MPSYLASGLAEGISPFAKSLAESRLKMAEEDRKRIAEEQKPSAQLQRGILDAIKAIQSAPQAGIESQGMDLERRAAMGEFGTSPNLQQLTATMTPTGRRIGQAEEFIKVLKDTGIGGLTSEGISFQKPTLDLESILQRKFMESQATELGRESVTGVPTEKNRMVTSLESGISAVDTLERLEKETPGILENIVRPSGLPRDPQSVQEGNLALGTLVNRVVTGEGGKQLTRTEIEFINAMLPGWLKGQFRNKEAIRLIGDVLRNAHRRVTGQSYIDFTGKSFNEIRGIVSKGLQGSQAQQPSQAQAGEDFSSMSDEELRAIAGM